MGILFLIGPRGCGKTLAAKHLADGYSCRSCDTDQLLVASAGRSIPEIVADEGWPAFREREKAALAEAVELMGVDSATPGIVATGGGIVLAPENRELMRRSGDVAYLLVPIEELFCRLRNAQEQSARPPLSDLSFEEEIRAVIAARDPLYRETAHHCIDGAMPPSAVARALYSITIRHP